MKIAFFGDSFCTEENNPHSFLYGYDTYLTKLKDHYNADIVNLGVGGSSHWDLIIKQFPKFKDDLPDVCIFCWTDYGRLYHPTVRTLTYGSSKNTKLKDFKLDQVLQYNVHKSAKEYFNHLYDDDKARLEYASALYHFDKTVLTELENKTKIIHIWSTGCFYQWSTGLEVRPSLNSVAQLPIEHKHDSMSANHLGGEKKNNIVFEWLRYAIDNHQNGKLFDNSAAIPNPC